MYSALNDPIIGHYLAAWVMVALRVAYLVPSLEGGF